MLPTPTIKPLSFVAPARDARFHFATAAAAALLLVASLAPSLRAAAPEAATYTSKAGEALPYLLLKPGNVEAGKRYPLVLFYHGAEERGSDNKAQWRNGVEVFADPENQKKYPCFVLAPQCPQDRRWVEMDWGADSGMQPKEPSVPMRLSLELLEKVKAEEPVDPDRVYVTGLSMGGYATWDVIARHPDLFAAAVPVCGGGDEATASRFAKLPLWAFHGGADNVVKPQRTRNMIKAVKEAGGDPKFTEYPGVGHNSWEKAYRENELLAWLFSQKRKG